MKKYAITKRLVVKVVSGVLYEMAPAHAPRNIDKIIKHCIDYFDEKVGKKYLVNLTTEEVRAFVKEMLNGCLEYRQLNLSQKEWDEGLRNPDAEERRGFAVVAVGHDESGTPCTVMSPKEYHDFIDLGASTPNIISEMIWQADCGEDCFLCKNSKEYMSGEPSESETCKQCTLNPNNKNNYEVDPKALIPHKRKHNDE